MTAPRRANKGTDSIYQSRDAAHVNSQQPTVIAPPIHATAAASRLWDPVLETLAAGLNDVEQTRIAQDNRLRFLTSADYGFGLPETHPSVLALRIQLDTLSFLEKRMNLALRKQLRAHPLHGWVKAQKGLGEKTIARLLAAVRDPYWNDLHGRPRSVGELFAFCGVAGPDMKRQRGVRSNWSSNARHRLWLIATTTVKTGGPYRVVYDAARERYAEKLHEHECAQCGVKGLPAQPGMPWRDGHKHAGAVRLVMRAILRDLWTESRAYYETQPSP